MDRLASLELLVGLDAVVAVAVLVLLVDEGVVPFKRAALRWNKGISNDHYLTRNRKF
jgi:hypothetical protein